jgi:excisionase family DNA binding protein
VPDEPLLSCSEVAAHLNVSGWLVRERIAAGDIPHVRIGRVIRVRPEALLAWERAQERGREA